MSLPHSSNKAAKDNSWRGMNQFTKTCFKLHINNKIVKGNMLTPSSHKSMFNPLQRKSSVYVGIWSFTGAIQIEDFFKCVCVGAGKMKRRIKSKNQNWLIRQQQQHRWSWRYWFIFFANHFFTTANATNDNSNQTKYTNMELPNSDIM